MNGFQSQIVINQPKRHVSEYVIDVYFQDEEKNAHHIRTKYDKNGETNNQSNKEELSLILSSAFIKDIERCIDSFQLIQQQIDEGTLTFKTLTLQQTEEGYRCEFYIKGIDFLFSMAFKPFLRSETNNRVHLKETIVVTMDGVINLDSRIIALLGKRVLYYLVKKSNYRPKLLFDHNFSFYQETAHFLKKGDRVRCNNATYNGKNEGIVQSFYISDEHVEMAVVNIDDRNWNWDLWGVKKIKDE